MSPNRFVVVEADRVTAKRTELADRVARVRLH
jgi:hypothetical protein